MTLKDRGDKPLYVRTKKFFAVCAPPAEMNLALSELNVQNGMPENTELAQKVYALITRDLYPERVYAINAQKPSARVVSPRRLTRQVYLAPYLRMHTNADLPFDGIWLKPFETGVFPSKGCPVIVFTGGKYFFMVHAGRDALIDRHRISIGEKSRRRESIIHEVVERFRRLGVPAHKISAHALFGVRPKAFVHAFDDPAYGELNQKMAAELNRNGYKVIKRYPDGKERFSLEELIKLQCEECGIGKVEYSHPLPLYGLFSIHSSQKSSNLVIITRKAA